MKLQKTLLILSASAVLGGALIAPDVALAQPFPGPRAADLPRPPGVGGGRPSLHGGQGNFYGRSGTYAYGHTGVYGRTPNYSYYGSNYGYYGYGRSGYAYGSCRHRYWAPYGVYIYSNSSSSDCYYT